MITYNNEARLYSLGVVLSNGSKIGEQFSIGGTPFVQDNRFRAPRPIQALPAYRWFADLTSVASTINYRSIAGGGVPAQSLGEFAVQPSFATGPWPDLALGNPNNVGVYCGLLPLLPAPPPSPTAVAVAQDGLPTSIYYYETRYDRNAALYRSLEANPAMATTNPALQAAYDSLGLAPLGTLCQAEAALARHDTAMANVLMSAANPQCPVDQLFHEVLALATAARDTAGLDSTQQDRLVAIATLCAARWGRPVYLARSLRAAQEECAHFYDDQCMNDDSLRLDKRGRVLETGPGNRVPPAPAHIAYSVGPNPAGPAGATLRRTGGCVPHLEAVLYSPTGAEVRRIPFPCTGADEAELHIPTHGLPAGLYQLSVEGLYGLDWFARLVVARY
jgi:hypothetical protein